MAEWNSSGGFSSWALSVEEERGPPLSQPLSLHASFIWPLSLRPTPLLPRSLSPSFSFHLPASVSERTAAEREESDGVGLAAHGNRKWRAHLFSAVPPSAVRRRPHICCCCCCRDGGSLHSVSRKKGQIRKKLRVHLNARPQSHCLQEALPEGVSAIKTAENLCCCAVGVCGVFLASFHT